MGRLQTFAAFLTLPGDSIEYNLETLIRFSPLRRPQLIDARVDFCAFWVPMRHCYDNWKDFILKGVDEDVNLAVVSANRTVPIPREGGAPFYLHVPSDFPGNIPAHLPRGYNAIWNEYFRDPHVARLARDYIADASRHDRRYGLYASALKTLATTLRSANQREIDANDYQVSVSANKVDIRDLNEAIARYRSETNREYRAVRYREVLKAFYGTMPNIDADQRPLMLAHDVQKISGIEVNGQDSASLGQSVGKTVGVHRFGFPRKMFPEHGVIWVVGLLRFPPIWKDEKHYAMFKANPGYTDIAGEPALDDIQRPKLFKFDDIFWDSPNDQSNAGYAPHAQWHRFLPNLCHPDFVDVDAGYPIRDDAPPNWEGLVREGDNYDQVFATDVLGHWQATGINRVMAHRVIGGVDDSLFLGAIGGRRP